MKASFTLPAPHPITFSTTSYVIIRIFCPFKADLITSKEKILKFLFHLIFLVVDLLSWVKKKLPFVLLESMEQVDMVECTRLDSQEEVQISTFHPSYSGQKLWFHWNQSIANFLCLEIHTVPLYSLYQNSNSEWFRSKQSPPLI